MPNSCPSTWYQCVFLSPTLRNLYSVDFRWSLGACVIIFFFTHSSNSYLCKWSSDFPTWWSTVFKSSLCNEQCYFFILGDSPFQLIGSAEPHARDEGEWADGVIHRGAFFPPYPLGHSSDARRWNPHLTGAVASFPTGVSLPTTPWARDVPVRGHSTQGALSLTYP